MATETLEKRLTAVEEELVLGEHRLAERFELLRTGRRPALPETVREDRGELLVPVLRRFALLLAGVAAGGADQLLRIDAENQPEDDEEDPADPAADGEFAAHPAAILDITAFRGFV